MKPKKNPSKDLRKDSGLYFVAGLALVLGMTLMALEWKTFAAEPEKYVDVYGIDEIIEEEVPPLIIEALPPPPPPVVPTVIDIIPDDSPIEDTIIEPTEPTEEPIKVTDVHFADEEPELDEIPFHVIEQVPIFPGCEDAKDQKACFSEMMMKHVKKNFRYPESAVDLNMQGRVSVMFEIGKDGNIAKVKMRGPHKVLETEAARIISKLPKMTPGKQRGQAVRVPFSIPINFVLQ